MTARRRSEAGFSSIEAALVVPVALGMILLIVQVMFAVYQNRNIQLAAEEGADAAARYGSDSSDGHDAANDVMRQLGVANAEIATSRSAEYVELTITAPVPRIFPLDLTTTATAAAPIEEFVDLADRS